MDINKLCNLTDAIHVALCYHIYGNKHRFAPNAPEVPERKANVLPIMKILVSADLNTDLELKQALNKYLSDNDCSQSLATAMKKILQGYENDPVFQKKSKRPPLKPAEFNQKRSLVTKTLERFHVQASDAHSTLSYQGLWPKIPGKMGHSEGFITHKRIRFRGDNPEKYLNIWMLKRGHLIDHEKSRIDSNIQPDVVNKEVLTGNVYRLFNGDHAAKFRLVNMPPPQKKSDDISMVASRWVSSFMLCTTSWLSTAGSFISTYPHRNSLTHALIVALLGVDDLNTDNYGFVMNDDVKEIHLIDFGDCAPGLFEISGDFSCLTDVLKKNLTQEKFAQTLISRFDLNHPKPEDLLDEIQAMSQVDIKQIPNMGAELGLAETAKNTCRDIKAVRELFAPLLSLNQKCAAFSDTSSRNNPIAKKLKQ